MITFTNVFNNENSTLSGLVCAEISDHILIFHIQKSDAESEVNPFKSRCFNNNNILSFQKTASQKDWNKVITHKDASPAYDSFLNTLTKIYNHCFPYKLIEKKNILYKSFLKYPSLINEAKFKKIQKQIN